MRCDNAVSISPALRNPAPKLLRPGARYCARGGPWHQPAGRESRERGRAAGRLSRSELCARQAPRPRDAAPPGPLTADGRSWYRSPMKLQYLGDSRDAFKWDLLHWLCTRAEPAFARLLFVPC